MIHYIKNKRPIDTMLLMVSALLISISFWSCDPSLSTYEYDLAEANSLEDLTPPSANFSAAVSSTDHLTINFANLSSSATDYVWNFGDGNSSTSKDGQNTYPDLGTYTVTLTATDKLLASDTFSMDIEVVEPAAIIPVINEASFEDGALAGGTGDGRDSWRISGGTIFGITSGPTRTGSQAAKFEVAPENRVGYQSLTVSPNTDYVVTLYYTMKTSPAGGEVRLAILGNAISDASEAEAAIIASTTGNNQVDANEYIQLSLAFNSGDTSTIAIWFDSNDVAEARVDDVSIALAP